MTRKLPVPRAFKQNDKRGSDARDQRHSVEMLQHKTRSGHSAGISHQRPEKWSFKTCERCFETTSKFGKLNSDSLSLSVRPPYLAKNGLSSFSSQVSDNTISDNHCRPSPVKQYKKQWIRFENQESGVTEVQSRDNKGKTPPPHVLRNTLPQESKDFSCTKFVTEAPETSHIFWHGELSEAPFFRTLSILQPLSTDSALVLCQLEVEQIGAQP